jgi:hypothetical protein
MILPVLLAYRDAYRSNTHKTSFKKTIIWPRSMVMMEQVMTIVHDVLGDIMNQCQDHLSVVNYHAASPKRARDFILRQLLDPDGLVDILIASPALGTGTNVISTYLQFSSRARVCLCLRVFGCATVCACVGGEMLCCLLLATLAALLCYFSMLLFVLRYFSMLLFHCFTACSLTA